MSLTNFLSGLKSKRKLILLWSVVLAAFVAVGTAGYTVGTYANTTIGLDEGCVQLQDEGVSEVYACEDKIVIILPNTALE